MEKNIPVKKNTDYILEINGLTSEGHGVGKIEGFTVFVEGALPGEKIKIKIVNIRSSYAFGKLLEILNKSKERVEPKCSIVNRCGGCQLQHLDYQEQLKYKTQHVRDSIERIGGLENILIHEAIGMNDPWRYRNKAQFPVGMGGVIGFYANRSHDIIDNQSCFIQDEFNDKITTLFKEYIKKYDIPIYDEFSGKGLIRHIVTRKGFKTGEIMICIVVNGEKLPFESELIVKLRENIHGLKSVVLNKNMKKTNVILGDKNRIIFGEEAIYDYIGDVKFKISPLSFFQVNPVQTEVLYNKALEYANLSGNETVIDAYCGIGTISLFLSKKAKKVYGVEIVTQAIENAKENAKINKVNNVEFLLGESETVIPELYKKGIKADVVVVDPPRKGCDEKLLNLLAEMQPERIVYVSCNPATLARDLKYLAKFGFITQEIQPVDMFPQTVHVECVVLMTRSGSGEKK